VIGVMDGWIADGRMDRSMLRRVILMFAIARFLFCFYFHNCNVLFLFLTFQVSTIHCPERTCNQMVSYNEVRLIVRDPEMLRKYDDFTLQQALEKMTDIRYRFCRSLYCSVFPSSLVSSPGGALSLRAAWRWWEETTPS
jgi:hypothetical protein